MKDRSSFQQQGSAGDLPFVFSNFAMTADGKITFANRRFEPFAGERDQEHMMELRATADAVMSGARTVDLSPATLGPGGKKFQRLRTSRGLQEFNLRVVVSGSGSIDPNAEIFKHRFSPIIVLTTARMSSAARNRIEQRGAIVKSFGRQEINFGAAFRWLKREWRVNRLLCEGGGELHDAVIRAGLLNQLHVTISPQIFGGSQAPSIADGIGFRRLGEAAMLRLKSMHRDDHQLFLVYDVTAAGRSGRSLSRQLRTVRASKRG